LSQSLVATSESVPVSKDEAVEIISSLKKVIIFHDWRYYVQSDPIITDYDYDLLFKQLKKIEEKYPDLQSPDSPTQRVAMGLTKDFPKAEHLVPMLSLDNSYNEDDLVEWDKKVKSLTGKEKIEYCVEPKFDGSSFALVYEDDLLVRGATRGDGTSGEEITNNVKVLRSIPLSAKFSEHGLSKVELRGEMLIDKEKFKQINEKRIEEGLPILINARNTASGALRIQDSAEVAKRGLEGFIYQMAHALDRDGNSVLTEVTKTHNESLDLLYSLGFKASHEEKKVCNNITEVVAYCNEWQEKREDFPYEIDGMWPSLHSLHVSITSMSSRLIVYCQGPLLRPLFHREKGP